MSLCNGKHSLQGDIKRIIGRLNSDIVNVVKPNNPGHVVFEGDHLVIGRILVMFGGVSLLAVAVSVVSNFLMSGAAYQLQAERAARRLRGHVIVVGVGSVGTAVVRALCAKGVPTVVVDAKADSDDFRAVQDLCPTIVGDAKRPEVLVRAGIHHAKCLLAVTSLDAANLEIALVAKEVAKETRPDHRLPVVLRCFDMAMARRINAVSGDYHVLSSAQIAAPVFVEKALIPRSVA